jgi:hypothetical protein
MVVFVFLSLDVKTSENHPYDNFANFSWKNEIKNI